MEEPSKTQRQWGLRFVQIGLPVIFFAGSEGKLGTVGTVVMVVAYALHAAGCGLFLMGVGKRFVEDRKHRALALGVIMGIVVCIPLGVLVTDLFKGTSTDAQICIVFVSQSAVLLLAWIGEEILFSERKENLGETAKK